MLDLSTLQVILAALSGVLTSVISGVVGMAGGIVFLSFLSFLLSYENLIPIHGAVQFFSNGSRFVFLRKHLVMPIFLWTVLGSSIGGYLSFLALKHIQDPTIAFLILGFLILYTVFKPKRMPEIKIPFWAFSFVGLFTGFLAPIVGAIGPFQAVFYIRDDLTKEQIVATKASTQFFSHVIKFPAFIALGYDYMAALPLIAVLTVSVLIGTRIGVKILGKISQEHFMLLCKGALLLSAIRIFYNAYAA